MEQNSRESIDIHNQQMYAKGPESDNRIFFCTLCGRRTCIDESYSNQGKNMVCGICARTKFKTPLEVMDYVQEREVEEHESKKHSGKYTDWTDIFTSR